MTGRPVYLFVTDRFVVGIMLFLFEKKKIYIKKKEGLFFREKKKGIGIGAK